ncbi:hypothetical protein M407DRAFT_85786, partial [Tulasnella calospora MUT 4182]
IKSIGFSSHPPEPGKDLTTTATGVARETIEDGAYANVAVKLGLVKLLRTAKRDSPWYVHPEPHDQLFR